ncbi:MAG: GNAT family N-acetyltransferase [Spirulina sp. SIO3F2]|nr:GNAT family N-acetyltransferase [Spirulina sp. SIO3F2]
MMLKTTTDPFVVQEISPRQTQLLQNIGELRIRAWSSVVPDAAQLTCWLDNYDATARHWAVFDGEKLIAAARMSIHAHLHEVPEPEVYVGCFPRPLPAPIASFNRLVVDIDYRRRGIAKTLDTLRLEAARHAHCASIVLATPSGLYRVRSLESLGFQCVGSGAPYQGPLFYVGLESKVLYLLFNDPI